MLRRLGHDDEATLAASVLYLALPKVSADLGATGNQMLWILDIYSFVLAGFLVTMGTLGDRIGRRRLLLIGAAAFGGASILAAYSTSAEMLIATRALLGLAGATLMPSTMALIRNMFPDPKQMGTAIGVWFSCFMGGMAIGPLVGGALLEQFWWGSAFLLGVPFMALLLVVGPVLLPEYRAPGTGRLDLVSVGLSLAAILPAIYGLRELARRGWDPVASAVVVGLAFGVIFVRRQRALADPLLDLRLFGYRALRSALSVYLLTGVVMAGVSLMSTVYLQSVLELSTLRAGLWLLPHNAALAAGEGRLGGLADGDQRRVRHRDGRGHAGHARYGDVPRQLRGPGGCAGGGGRGGTGERHGGGWRGGGSAPGAGGRAAARGAGGVHLRRQRGGRGRPGRLPDPRRDRLPGLAHGLSARYSVGPTATPA
jgi:MFS family permease